LFLTDLPFKLNVFSYDHFVNRHEGVLAFPEDLFPKDYEKIYFQQELFVVDVMSSFEFLKADHDLLKKLSCLKSVYISQFNIGNKYRIALLEMLN